MKYILAIDQGTTSSRTVLFDELGHIVKIKQKEFTQYFPQPGWVEHDPEEIWSTQYETLRAVLSETDETTNQYEALGITNQRETTIVWHAETGEAIYPAIVWQDKRTTDLCQQLINKGKQNTVQAKTGLVLDSYFSATKINWILSNVPSAKSLAKEGKLRFGTVDTWLIWRLTDGKKHVTDCTNASRTLLYNIHSGDWDDELLSLFDIPRSMLPEVKPSAAHFGDFTWKGRSIPISGVAGDQQAALFGQACHTAGMAKNTYGTGCFLLMNTGEAPIVSSNGLLTTRACSLDSQPQFALEGSIFIAGAAIQWLRDSLRIIDKSADSEYFARQAANDEVVVVPAFAGMGAPYWNAQARGAIFGLTRDTGKNHLIKATLQSLAFQTKDVLEAMQRDSGISLNELRVDGGATHNHFLMQFQADMLQVPVERPQNTETTAAGAAFLAGIQSGLWKKENIANVRRVDQVFLPQMDEARANTLYSKWKKAVNRTLNWLEE